MLLLLLLLLFFQNAAIVMKCNKSQGSIEPVTASKNLLLVLNGVFGKDRIDETENGQHWDAINREHKFIIVEPVLVSQIMLHSYGLCGENFSIRDKND